MSNVVSLQDLWGYIPYGLAFVLPDQTIDFLVPPSSGHLPLTGGFVRRGGSFSLSDVRPILRPMSFLSKPIRDFDYRVDSFIPAMELALYCSPDIPEDSWIVVDRDYFVMVYTFTPQGRITHYFGTNESMPKGCFDLLYRWRFDVGGLIERGLAVDADTLDCNPYSDCRRF